VGSKKFKGKTCAYCRKRPSVDGDHVICREFFPINRRSDLPKVPACRECNHEKSLIEHYLTAVLPFGARHGDARDVMEMTPKRLAANKALYERLSQGLRHVFHSKNGAPWEMDATLPIDGEAVEKLFEYIVRGLAWHHWSLELENCWVRASFIKNMARPHFDKFFNGEARSRVSGNLGGGGFTYEGIQSMETETLTMWRMSLYGLVVSDNKENSDLVYGVTIPRDMAVAKRFLTLMGMTV
jgi:hypothetical protein